MVDDIKRLFARKRSLKDVSTDDLRREKIRLEQEEARLVRQVDELEKQKGLMFTKGIDEASERQRRILATKIAELDSEAGSVDKQLRFISQQLRAVSGFIQLKENQRMFQQVGLGGLLNNLDLTRLQELVREATVGERFQMDKFEGILRTMNETAQAVGEPEEAEGVQKIMDAMEEARIARLEAPGTSEAADKEKLTEAPQREQPAR